MRLGFEIGEDRARLAVGECLEPLHQRARGFVAQPRRRIAVGAQHAGARRHDHRPGVDQLRQRIGVQRPGAAERDQREVAGIVALLYGDKPQRAAHVLVDDIDDALGRFFQAEAERVGDFAHRLFGSARSIVMSPPSLASAGR